MTKKTNTKKQVGVIFDLPIYEHVKKDAEKNDRKVGPHVHNIVKNYLEDLKDEKSD